MHARERGQNAQEELQRKGAQIFLEACHLTGGTRRPAKGNPLPGLKANQARLRKAEEAEIQLIRGT